MRTYFLKKWIHIQYPIKICFKPLKQVPGPMNELVGSLHSFPPQHCPYSVSSGRVSWMPHVSPPTLHSSPKKTKMCKQYMPTIHKQELYFTILTNAQIIVMLPSNVVGFNAHHFPFWQHTRSLTGSPSLKSGLLQLLLPSTQKLSKSLLKSIECIWNLSFPM